MKKTLIFVGMLAVGYTNAQTEEEYDGRVGININKPNASLDISRHTDLPETSPQGVLFPKLSTAQRDRFTLEQAKHEGLMIYNTDKKCIEMYMGVVSGVHQWSCLPNTGSSQQQNLSITPVGFEGVFAQGTRLSTYNKVKFKIVNNSFFTINNIDFSSAVRIQNGTARITATGVNTNNVSLTSGQERILEYALSGSPENGRLTANFDHLSLSATQSIQVGMGSASFSFQTNDHSVVSLIYNSTVVQGKINNGANKITIKIPYTNGRGSYNAFTNTQTTAAGQGNDTNPLTLNISAGNFGETTTGIDWIIGRTGELTATITVGGDGEYLVKQMAPGQEYTIATFPININGSTTNVVLKGVGGVLDRKFGDGSHNFVYIPIEVTGANGYRKTWLNNNLGAEYSKVGSASFNPIQQATAHNDYKAYGSLFQWQRPADGHELITWTGATTGTPSATTNTLSNKADWTAGHSNFILNTSLSSRSWVNNTINESSNNKNLWQSKGANNPCPVGYHVPTKAEWDELHTALGGYNGYAHWAASALRLPAAGWRSHYNGVLGKEDNIGSYWSSEADRSGYSWYLSFIGDSSGIDIYGRASGHSVRCIKD